MQNYATRFGDVQALGHTLCVYPAYNCGMDMSDDEAIKAECGRRIQAARKAVGWRLEDLAQNTGLKPSRIGNWEQGTRMPGPKEATLLGRALGISPAYILLVEENMLLFEEEAELLKVFRALAPEDQQNYLAMLNRLNKLRTTKQTPPKARKKPPKA